MSLLHPTNSMETDRQQKAKSTLSTPEILDFFANLPPRPYTELQGHRERCIPIIQKFHGNRTKEEEALLVSVLKQFNFLENASEDDVKENKILSRLSQILEYEVFPAGTPICHKGELGNKFYLIIKGRAIAYSEQPIGPEESAVQKSFRGHQHNSSQLVLDRDSFSGKSFLLPDDQRQKVLKRNRSNIFQPRIVKRDLNKLIGQGNIRVGDKKFSRENPPQTTWDVDRVLSFIGPITKGKLASSNDGSKEIDEKYVEMLLEYKLLEAVAEKLPGKYVRNGQFLYRAAKRLREGDFFGEHALVTNRPRNVTVIASQDLHCFTISKMDYQHVSLRRIESISPNIQFLQKFFPEAAKPALIKIAHLFEECRYTSKQVIFEEDSQPDGIYFIKEGKVQLSKRIKNKADQFYVVSEAKQALKNVIAILGNGDIFGDEEVLLQKNREFSATVTSNDAVILKLDKKVYDSLSSEHKSLFYNLGKTSSKPKRSSKSQPKAPSVDGRTLTENIETKKSAIKWPEYQEMPTGNSYDIFSKFSGFVEINSAKFARSNNFFEDQSLLLQHQKQLSLNTNILSTTVSSNVITMTRPSKKVTPTDNLSRGSKKFFKRIFYQDEINNKDKEKSQTEPSEPLTAKTESQYEAEAKPYILRLDTDIGAPTPEVDINNNKPNVPSQTQNDYMLVKAQNRFKDSNNSDNNKSLQKKKGSLKKIIEFRLNLELPQTSSRKETRGTTTAQTNVSVNLSQDESSGVKEGESSSVISLKKAWRPPTAGGYYSVQRENAQAQKLSSSREKISPANLTLLKRLHSQKTTRERTETYEFSGNVSTRVNTSQASKRRSNLLKPRPSPREESGEEDLTSSKTGKSFAEYFKGLAENEGVSGRRTANTPTRANVNSNTSNTAISKSMVKMRTTTEFFKKREDIRNRVNVSGERMLTVQTLLLKPC